MNRITSLKFLLLSIVLMSSLSYGAEVDNESKQLTVIIEQLNLMQQELRLVTKEVVGLSTKLETLKNTQIAVAKNYASKPNAGPQSILFDGNDYKSPRLGSKDAQYAIIEFSDYECPYCTRYAKQVFPQIKKRYIDSGKFQYVVRDFPLAFHSQAKPAAIAADCAGEQSKFWSMNDALFENSRKLRKELYPELAKEIGLDEGAFLKCLADPEIAARVDADFSYGQSVGVNGTPRFYIGKIKGNSIVNVIPLSGAQPLAAFDKVIQQVMSKS